MAEGLIMAGYGGTTRRVPTNWSYVTAIYSGGNTNWTAPSGGYYRFIAVGGSAPGDGSQLRGNYYTGYGMNGGGSGGVSIGVYLLAAGSVVNLAISTAGAVFSGSGINMTGAHAPAWISPPTSSSSNDTRIPGGAYGGNYVNLEGGYGGRGGRIGRLNSTQSQWSRSGTNGEAGRFQGSPGGVGTMPNNSSRYGGGGGGGGGRLPGSDYCRYITTTMTYAGGDGGASASGGLSAAAVPGTAVGANMVLYGGGSGGGGSGGDANSGGICGAGSAGTQPALIIERG